jgi:hypothetical protein
MRTECCLTLTIAVILGGCASLDTTPSAAPVDLWQAVSNAPADIVKAAEDHDRAISATSWSFEGVQARAFRHPSGHWRVCWIKKDPLRDSYWFSLVQLTPEGEVQWSPKSTIPSDLLVPDPRAIDGWQTEVGVQP